MCITAEHVFQLENISAYDIMKSVINMIEMKDIIQEGHPLLRKRAVDVTLPLEQTDLNTLRDMMTYVIRSQDPEISEQYLLRSAVGIAAPQIAIPKKMFVIRTTDETMTQLHQYAVVNPKIISFSEELTYIPGGEGCLSVDEDKNGLVPRSTRIKAKVHLVNLETGETTETLLKLSGYVGIVFQHEYDHLLGVLFVDRKKEDLSNLQPIIFPEPEGVTE
jgi:peptide deformylase